MKFFCILRGEFYPPSLLLYEASQHWGTTQINDIKAQVQVTTENDIMAQGQANIGSDITAQQPGIVSDDITKLMSSPRSRVAD